MILVKTKIIALLAFTYLLAAGGVVVVMSLMIARDSAELNTQVRVIADSSALLKQYAELTAFMEQTEADREKLKAFIVHENDIIAFLSEVETVGRTLGLSVQTTNLDTQADPDSLFDTLYVSLTLSGAEQSAYTFLELMENLPYAQQILSFTFSRDAVNQDQVSGALQIALAMKSYE